MTSYERTQVRGPKTVPKLFLLELCQFSTEFDMFWHTDGQDSSIM